MLVVNELVQENKELKKRIAELEKEKEKEDDIKKMEQAIGISTGYQKRIEGLEQEVKEAWKAKKKWENLAIKHEETLDKYAEKEDDGNNN